jgi:hypothetical protein
VDALLWAILTATALALALLACVSREHAATALRTAIGLWIAGTFVLLPLLLTRS